MAEKEKLSRETMAFRVAKEFEDGMVVNLGIGIPTLCANYPSPDKEILYQTENGALNFGPNTTPEEADLDLVNAGGQMVSAKPGMALFAHDESFAMIRGGHIDLCVLGVMQVSEKGDLANWLLPERGIGSIGGAVVGNAGCYGQGIADVLVSAAVLDTESGDIEQWEPARFEFLHQGCRHRVSISIQLRHCGATSRVAGGDHDPAFAASFTTTAVAGAVVSKPTATNTTVFSGLSLANCSASSLLRTTLTFAFACLVSSEWSLPGTRIMSP